MLSVVFITILVPSDDPKLFGGSGDTSASPFVIALDHAGIKGLPDFLNVVIMIGIIAIAVESIYIASRILRALSAQGIIPKFISRVDSKGRPRWALAITISIAVILTYINLSGKYPISPLVKKFILIQHTATGIVVFTWLVSITSSSFFLVWFVIAITSWRFRAALKAQNDPLFTEVYAYRCMWWPIPPIYLFSGSCVLLVCCIYIGLYPIVRLPSSPFLFPYISPFLILEY
jgi:amino acid transporter